LLVVELQVHLFAEIDLERQDLSVHFDLNLLASPQFDHVGGDLSVEDQRASRAVLCFDDPSVNESSIDCADSKESDDEMTKSVHSPIKTLQHLAAGSMVYSPSWQFLK